MRTDDDAASGGMLDTDQWDRHNGGIARCTAADCGWEGVPSIIGGKVSTRCPSCECDEEAINAELDAEEARIIGPKVGRNEPCPCGSGRKFKKCCGA